MSHKPRIVRNSRCSSGHHPKSFDLIDQRFPIRYSQHMNYMRQPCTNRSCRFQTVLLPQEYIRHQDTQIFSHRLVCGVQSWKTTPTFKIAMYGSKAQAAWSYDHLLTVRKTHKKWDSPELQTSAAHIRYYPHYTPSRNGMAPLSVSYDTIAIIWYSYSLEWFSIHWNLSTKTNVLVSSSVFGFPSLATFGAYVRCPTYVDI